MALFVTTLSVRGQLHVDRSLKWKYGVTAGLNMTKMSVTDPLLKPYTNKTKAGFMVGPTVSLHSTVGGFGGNASILLDYRSAVSKDNIGYPLKSLSLQLPVNLSYYFNTSDLAMPFVFMGPQFSLNLGTVEHSVAFGVGETTDHTLYRKWINKRSVFSLNFGVGVLAMETVMVRLGYNMPLQYTGVFFQTDLDANVGREIGTGKMGSVQMMVSYLF